MSSQMSFFGSYVYESASDVEAAKEKALDNSNGTIALFSEDILINGVDLRFSVDNHFPSVFYSRTLVALSAIAESALCGSGGGTCGEWGQDGYENEFQTAFIEIEALPKPLVHTQERIVQHLVTGSEDDIRRAHRIARVSDIPTLGRVWKMLPIPILKARLARVFIGRKERRAQLIQEEMENLPFEESGPHADEIRRIQAEIAKGELLANPPDATS